MWLSDPRLAPKERTRPRRLRSGQALGCTFVLCRPDRAVSVLPDSGLHDVRDAGDGVLLYRCTVAESCQPRDVRLAAKPGHLTLRVVAVGLLGSGDCGVTGETSSQQLNNLPVAERA